MKKINKMITKEVNNTNKESGKENEKVQKLKKLSEYPDGSRKYCMAGKM